MTEDQDGPETTPEQETPDTEKLLTQAEVNALVEARLKRERNKFADYAELKSFKQQAEQNRLATLSEAEKQIEAAREEGRLQARQEYATSIVAAKIEAALAGVVESPSELVSDLDLRKYLTSEGEADEEAIQTLRKKYESLVGKKRQSTSSVGHGNQTVASTGSPREAFANFLGQFG